MRTQVVIGVDGGTTAVKAVAFNLDGSIVTMAHRNVPVIYGSNGEAEQNMAEIWNGVADCLKEITGTLGESYEILAVGLTGQGDGLWLVDQEGHPVRNAPNWMDGRAAKRAQEWISDGRGQAILETTGTTIFPGLAPVILAELNESSPDTLEHAATILYCKDWLRFNLTGERLTDYTEASRTFLDIHTA
ncbi:FGGY family carbohydrate kinase [Trueperella pyogenes]|uniref:FGGY family carbohydrate kinase n=1 Tax=Trueperella pyogenes TaxID=1661 RepID=UPI00312B3121